MEKVNTLDHLLQIESQAAALVNDAQAEADRRVRESEKKNRASYDETFKSEVEKRETSLKKEQEKIRAQYQQALNEYRNEISTVNADERKFSSLLNSYLAVGER